ncbi:hypothetical protein L9F63_027641, partial [Diploptera punctata]
MTMGRLFSDTVVLVKKNIEYEIVEYMRFLLDNERTTSSSPSVGGPINLWIRLIMRR